MANSAAAVANEDILERRQTEIGDVSLSGQPS